jgi:hypothetical protein
MNPKRLEERREFNQALRARMRLIAAQRGVPDEQMKWLGRLSWTTSRAAASPVCGASQTNCTRGAFRHLVETRGTLWQWRGFSIVWGTRLSCRRYLHRPGCRC